MSEAFVNATFGPLSHACRDPWYATLKTEAILSFFLTIYCDNNPSRLGLLAKKTSNQKWPMIFLTR